MYEKSIFHVNSIVQYWQPGFFYPCNSSLDSFMFRLCLLSWSKFKNTRCSCLSWLVNFIEFEVLPLRREAPFSLDLVLWEDRTWFFKELFKIIWEKSLAWQLGLEVCCCLNSWHSFLLHCLEKLEIWKKSGRCWMFSSSRILQFCIIQNVMPQRTFNQSFFHVSRAFGHESTIYWNVVATNLNPLVQVCEQLLLKSIASSC